MMIWMPQGADTKRFALRLTLIAALLAAVAVGGWFLSTTAHSAAPKPKKCQCIPENGLEFKNWQAGPERVHYIPERRPRKTFITNRQTFCKVYAEAGAVCPEDADIPPIKWYWFPSMTHGFELQPRGLLVGLWMEGRFIYWGSGFGDRHEPQTHPGNGRGNTPMRIDLTLEALYECPSFCGRCGPFPACPMWGVKRTYTAELVLSQDPIDVIRQEYVDHDDHPEYGALSVPSRNDFGPLNAYVTEPDSYNYMVDKGLASFHESWAKQCTIILRSHVIKNLKKQGMGEKEAEKEAGKHTLTMDHLPVNSGYRNPEHNWEHVLEQGYDPAWHSPHQYGGALDVSARNIDMNDDGERGTEADKDLMLEAAEASFRELSVTGSKYKYTNTSHVHAEWRP